MAICRPERSPDPVLPEKVLRMTNNAHKPSLTPIMDLGLIDYQEALDLQQQYVEEKKSGIRKQDIILVLEHPAVFTLGRRGGRENLVVSEAFLKERGIPVVQTGRGGNITFHGPGPLPVGGRRHNAIWLRVYDTIFVVSDRT